MARLISSQPGEEAFSGRFEVSETPHWGLAGRLTAIAALPLLLGMSITIIPSGSGGVRVSQFAGTLPGTLYPGVHWIMPLVDHVETYSIRDNVFTTTLPEMATEGKPNAKPEFKKEKKDEEFFDFFP